MSGASLERLDAQLFTALNSVLASHPEDVEPLLAKIVPLSKLGQLRFNQPANILRSFIFGVSSITVNLEVLVQFAQQITLRELESELLDTAELSDDVENLLLWTAHEYSIELPGEEDSIETARAIEADYAQRSKLIGYTSCETYASFIMAKIIQLSRYTTDLEQYDFLFKTVQGVEGLAAWYHGVVVPYTNFRHHFGTVLGAEVPAFEYLSRETYNEKLDFFLQPYNAAVDKAHVAFSPQKLLTSVLLPLALYYGGDLSPLLDWTYTDKKHPSWLSRLLTFQNTTESVLNFTDYKGQSIPIESLTGFVSNYIALAYYFAFYGESSVSSVDVSRAYDMIDNSLTSLIELLDVTSSGGSLLPETVDVDNLPEYSSFSEFVSSERNPLKPLFRLDLKACIAFLKNVIATCCQVFPVNGLTVSKYLKLSQDGLADLESVKKEVLRVLAHLESSNHEKLLHSVKLISSSFVKGDKQLEGELDHVIFERLLGVGLFPVATEFYNNNASLSVNQAFDVVLKKFRHEFDEANSLDERIGHLKQAHECITLLSTLSSSQELDETYKGQVVKLKHLLKALNSLKNFKLSLDGKSSARPLALLSKITRTDENEHFTPFSIVSLVLEQNPKSYHAYEKLYRIVNDLAIYLGIALSHVPFARIQSACIESALIDNNFDFAYKHSKILFDHYASDNTLNLSEYWLTFYQTAKFVSPEWFNDDDIMIEKKKLEIYLKQRELLFLTLKLSKPTSSTVDNSRLILNQLKQKEKDIDVIFDHLEQYSEQTSQMQIEPLVLQIPENAGRLLNEASKTTSHASDKLSNLFVSGLGWAIGAKKSDVNK